MIQIKKHSLIACLLILISCNSVEQREFRTNDPVDIRELKIFIDNYYKTIKAKQFDSIGIYFGGKISPQEGVKFMKDINELHGDIMDYDAVYVKTEVKILNESTSKNYCVEAKIKYEKKKCQELFDIVNINDSLKISSFQCNYN